MYTKESNKEARDLENVEKFNIPIHFHTTKSQRDLIAGHQAHMILNHEGGGTIKFSDALRGLIDLGLAAAKELLPQKGGEQS
jgi:hypothetical protein